MDDTVDFPTFSRSFPTKGISLDEAEDSISLIRFFTRSFKSLSFDFEIGFGFVTVSSHIPVTGVCAESEFSLPLFFVGLFFADFSFGADVFAFFILGGFDMLLLLFTAFSFVVTFFELVVVEADAFTFLLFTCFLLLLAFFVSPISTWLLNFREQLLLDGIVCSCASSCQESVIELPLTLVAFFLFFTSLSLFFFGMDGDGMTEVSEIEAEASTPIIFCK